MHQSQADVEPTSLPAGELEQSPILEAAELEPRRELRQAPYRLGLGHALEPGLGDQLLADLGAGGRSCSDLGDVTDVAPDAARVGEQVVSGHRRGTPAR